ncbi:Membrane-anchored ubiquitin-fold protein [Thalictrum thalictroides]|uniref:Membrane-anchored ubiquitin-fold protein n=1 Tax=Thalictrum thalictroides TaxID=46969 RepID=A0A7J6VPG7_THATH|nr:Membrane-anchored ubiquitin-fold protein [Thalictrum thalictroides]
MRGSSIMAEGEESVELKFRVYDGTDIAHHTYASSTTVATLKERLVAEWPHDKTHIPKSVNDVKLIYAGRVLENNKTLAESRIPFGDLPGGVITMHVVVQPPLARKKTDKNTDEKTKQNLCSCTIL